MSKQRFLGGLLGANPFRDGSFTDTSIFDTYDFSNATVQLGSNGGASEYVGYSSVSISKDGNTAVTSSIFDNGGAGHVLVFEKSGSTWSQVAALTSPEAANEVSFGHDTDISDDGTVIIVSDNQNKKSQFGTGINYGNVYVYEKGTGWANALASHTKTFLLTDNYENGVNYLGDAITISGDGNTIAAGNRLGTSNRGYASSNTGSVYLWEKNGTWAATSSTPTILISTNQATNGKFGCDEKHAISLSEDGQTLAIRHKSRTTEGRLEIHEAGGGGWTAPSNSSATSAHHVSILDGTGSGNGHGNRVAISNDGLTIASEVVGNNTIIIHEKGAGWPSVGMTSQVATLSNSAASSTMSFNGMSKNGNYVTAYDASSYELLIWVKPATGWVNATETYRIAADATSTSTFGFGQWAAINDVGDLIISDARHASNAGRVEFHSGTNSVEIDRTTPNVGILSLDEAGPEANGSNELTQLNWGGIRGRDVLTGGTGGTSEIPQGSTSFDGINDYIEVGAQAQSMDLSGAFTLEAWVRLNSTSGTHRIFDLRTVTVTLANTLMIDYAGGFRCFVNGSNQSSQPVATVNTWHHIAAVRDGSNNFAFFVDGSRAASTSSSVDFTLDYDFVIGTGGPQFYQDGSSSAVLNGYMSETRISNTARYDPTAASISVPTAQFEDDTNTLMLLRLNEATISDVANPSRTITAGGVSNSTSVYKFSTVPAVAASDPSLANTGILSLSEALQASYGAATAVFGATGGVEDTTSVSGYKLHTFYNDGTATGGTGNTDYHTNHTFTVTGAAGEVELLLISGGGAGGQLGGGGGGAGAVMISNAFTLDPGDYTVTVGAGGLGLPGSNGNGGGGTALSPNNGRPTTFTDGGYASTTGTGQDHAGSTFSITAVGGQAGEAGENWSSQTRPAGANSGGQGFYSNVQSWSPTNATISWPSGYSGTIHSGYNGGTHSSISQNQTNAAFNCGGGAGAGGNGSNATYNSGGNGGAGVSVSGFSASTLSVAGGGGAGSFGYTHGTGTHGGGNGTYGGSTSGKDATSYGAGGGGGTNGGHGSHGLVVIRYQV